MMRWVKKWEAKRAARGEAEKDADGAATEGSDAGSGVSVGSSVEVPAEEAEELEQRKAVKDVLGYVPRPRSKPSVHQEHSEDS